jgi:hypothetical protein
MTLNADTGCGRGGNRSCIDGGGKGKQLGEEDLDLPLG